MPNYDVLDNCKKESVKITQLKFNGTISQNMKDCRVVDLKKLKLKNNSYEPYRQKLMHLFGENKSLRI